MEDHDEFLELCALSTSGDLAENEKARLHAHLANCADCREALNEFQAAVDVGVPLLSGKLGRELAENSERRHAVPMGPASSPDRDHRQENLSSDLEKRSFAFAYRNGRRPRVNWTYVWVPFAACVVLSMLLAAYTYRVGKTNGHPLIVSDGSPVGTVAERETLEAQISDAEQARENLQSQLGARDKTIAELRHAIEQQSSSLAQLKADQAKLEQSFEADETDTQRLAEERASLAQKLDAAQASVLTMETELVSAQQERAQGGSQDASLEAQIVDLNRQLRDREQTIGQQDELLSHDRDIRDLMGARDLYIAEVYDVGRDGETKKARGRVFYTRGKSLVFYAYDLDQQPGVKNTNTFQVWGRRGADMQEAVKLGIFFEDNAAKKRWVVKSDDANTLEQIDAVFVTVEPNGGSNKPSGKPLLFAYLKIDPNHP
jgi:anti-sigma-K factor RskA/putative zinc finger protein